MAQGNSKGLPSASGSGGRQSKHAQNPKKGARSIPPKKLGAVVRRTMQKNLSSKINNSIEKQMVTAASGGKLTIMKNKGDTPAEVKAAKVNKTQPKTGLKYEKVNPHDRQNI